MKDTGKKEHVQYTVHVDLAGLYLLQKSAGSTPHNDTQTGQYDWKHIIETDRRSGQINDTLLPQICDLFALLVLI